jgi:Leucine-rich repeat (LRR) protein
LADHIPLTFISFSFLKNPSARTKVMGTLPTELCLLTELQALVLNRNLLSGEIPECLTTMPKLKQLDLRGNDLSGPLPNDFFLSSSLESLDLSRNKLTGSIGTPPAFSVTRNHFPSNLKFKTINLDDNLLSGYIDNIFIYFTGLETLTLHNNNMVGGIDAMCTHPLKELTADCDKITCTCCTQCFNDP